MPKPVLSDSLFNADDVATAILSEANLQITNNSLGITDISSSFSFASGWVQNHNPINAYKFMGFVYINISCYHGGGTPANNEVLVMTSNSDYTSSVDFTFPTLSYQKDGANAIKLLTNGDFTVVGPENVGSSDYVVLINGYYRLNAP